MEQIARKDSSEALAALLAQPGVYHCATIEVESPHDFENLVASWHQLGLPLAPGRFKVECCKPHQGDWIVEFVVEGVTFRAPLARSGSELDPSLLWLFNTALRHIGSDLRFCSVCDPASEERSTYVLIEDSHRELLAHHELLAPPQFNDRLRAVESDRFEERDYWAPAQGESLIEALAAASGNEANACADELESALIEGRRQLLRGEKVKMPGFGQFIVRERPARRGRNPATGETITMPAVRVLTFEPAALLRHRLNPSSVAPPTNDGVPWLSRALVDVCCSPDYDAVVVAGIGVLVLEMFRGYTGRNPRTGEAIVVAPKVLPRLIVDDGFQAALMLETRS